MLGMFMATELITDIYNDIIWKQMHLYVHIHNSQVPHIICIYKVYDYKYITISNVYVSRHTYICPFNYPYAFCSDIRHTVTNFGNFKGHMENNKFLLYVYVNL